MIVQKEFLTKLRDFGLNSYESKLWTALLSRGSSTAGELSDIAAVPRSRSYDVLESLEKKGFIIMRPGKPIKYVAVPPNEVIERIKKKIEEKTKTQLDMISQLKTGRILSELTDLYDQGLDLVEPIDLTGSIKGRENIYNHLSAMIKNAKQSIVIATTSEGLIRKAEDLKDVLQKAKLRGVSIKITAPLSKDTKGIAAELSKIAEVKDSDIRTRLCVVDSKEVLFMLSDDNDTHPSYDIGIWANTQFFSKVLSRLF
ncbi:MAG: helix-turn-helix domain-containing protein [Nanoarchaeota archaeon]